MSDSSEYFVDQLRGVALYNNSKKYLVKWTGFNMTESTWEDDKDVDTSDKNNFKKLILESVSIKDKLVKLMEEEFKLQSLKATVKPSSGSSSSTSISTEKRLSSSMNKPAGKPMSKPMSKTMSKPVDIDKIMQDSDSSDSDGVIFISQSNTANTTNPATKINQTNSNLVNKPIKRATNTVLATKNSTHKPPILPKNLNERELTEMLESPSIHNKNIERVKAQDPKTQYKSPNSSNAPSIFTAYKKPPDQDKRPKTAEYTAPTDYKKYPIDLGRRSSQLDINKPSSRSAKPKKAFQYKGDSKPIPVDPASFKILTPMQLIKSNIQESEKKNMEDFKQTLKPQLKKQSPKIPQNPTRVDSLEAIQALIPKKRPYASRDAPHSIQMNPVQLKNSIIETNKINIQRNPTNIFGKPMSISPSISRHNPK